MIKLAPMRTGIAARIREPGLRWGDVFYDDYKPPLVAMWFGPGGLYFLQVGETLRIMGRGRVANANT